MLLFISTWAKNTVLRTRHDAVNNSPTTTEKNGPWSSIDCICKTWWSFFSILNFSFSGKGRCGSCFTHKNEFIDPANVSKCCNLCGLGEMSNSTFIIYSLP